METNNRSVFNRVTRKSSWYGAGVAVLAAGVLASTGAIHLRAWGEATPSPIVATEAPMSPSEVSPLVALNRATEAVVEDVMPAVVSINVIGTSQVQPAQMPGMNQIPGPFRQFFFGGPNPVQPQPRSQTFQALGSGVIISPDGYIVTNNHVVDGAKQVEVTLHNQQQYKAKVVGTDKATDLAVIKIDATGLTSAAFGDSGQLKPGETVLAIGNPMDMNFSVTRGIVSATNRPRTAADGPDSRGVFIQTDAAINHGNSGGPLVNVYGQVVGINTEMLSESDSSAGIGFAIPSNLVKPTAESLIKNGKVLRGYLGIQVTDVTPSIAASLNEAGTQGALIDSVNAGSPAAAAGLKPYDVVTRFNGDKVATGSDLQMIAGGTAPGTVAHLEVLRDGKPMNVSVTLGNFDEANSATPAEPASGASSGTPKLGITVAPLTPDLRSQMQLPDAVNGLVVESVDTNSPAMLAGVQQGDVIEQVNQHPVTTVQDLQHQLGLAPAGKSILLLDHKSNGDFILPVTPQQ